MSIKRFEELLGRYWEIAHREGRTGDEDGDEANAVLHEMRQLVKPRGELLIHEEVEAFKKWFDAWWLGDGEHNQSVPTQGHELFANYISEYTLAFGAWMAAKKAAHGIKGDA